MSEFETPNMQVPVNNFEEKERRELAGKLKVLVVEDQYYPQYNLLSAVKKHFGEYIKDFKNGQDVKVIDNFVDAQKASQAEGLKGSIVFLDNRMPLEPVDRTDMNPYMQGRSNKIFGEGAFQLFEEDEDFGDYPLGDGYKLIEAFKNAGAIVVGTSSMNKEELRSNGLESPDFVIVKMNADESIGEMSERILDVVERKLKE